MFVIINKMLKFYLFILSDSDYMLEMDINIKEKVKLAILKATDSNNFWVEYDINGVTFCTIVGKELAYQCNKKFWAMLKQFKYTPVDFTSQIAGYDIDSDNDSDSDNDNE